MFRVQLRTGSGRIGGVFAALSIVLHLTLRGTGWRYEWLWALTQYAFVTIFRGHWRPASPPGKGPPGRRRSSRPPVPTATLG